MYSFIKPRRKTVLTEELKLVLFFFGVTLFLLLGSYGILAYKSSSFYNLIITTEQTTEETKVAIASMEDEIELINFEVAKAEQLHTSNVVLRDSIKNLFDLIPDRIVLTRAELGKKSLILYGITPNKEVYDFMLLAPLRSIFHQTYSSFYPAGEGWYRFVSKNYLDEEQL